VVSSDLAELLRLCDRISIVVGGRIVQTLGRGDLDSAEDLHRRVQVAQPANELVT